METFLNINGLPAYQISNYQNVKSLSRLVKRSNGRNFITKERIMHTHIDNHGYVVVGLSFNGKLKKHYLHRLIATAFIPNPDNKPQVNHIDGNRSNNSIENLEWCTCKENNNHCNRSS